METVTTLDDKVRAFKVLLDKKDELAEQTKANNEELKNLEQEIAQQMWTRKSRILRWMASSTACRRKRDTPRFQKKS